PQNGAAGAQRPENSVTGDTNSSTTDFGAGSHENTGAVTYAFGPVARPGLRLLGGAMKGAVAYLPADGEVIVSSSGTTNPMFLNIEGYPGIGSLHCRIGYNASAGCYEVVALGDSAVFSSDGQRLPNETSLPFAPGSGLFIGSPECPVELLR
ncbi:MAG: hypothetical protein K6C36_09275, partial [Clostridia bacterium]|nr:hypothetical protein [Clostridia bacterium]